VGGGASQRSTAGSTRHMATRCSGTFIDAGANSGDSLHMWYTAESCATAPHALRRKPCAWQWPWWLPLTVRLSYCALAYEPNPQLAGQLLHTAAVLRRKLGVHIEVFNGTAFAELDGTAMFGLDSTTGNAEGSSLMLHKRTKTREGLGRGPAVGEHRVRVRTVNALSVIRHAPPGPVALKIDVEGYEGRLMRNLLLSGVLCQRVQNLFVEWHLMASQVDKRDLHHPDEDIEMPPQTMAVYKWMLSTFNPKAKALGRNWQPLADSSCNLTLLNWS